MAQLEDHIARNLSLLPGFNEQLDVEFNGVRIVGLAVTALEVNLLLNETATTRLGNKQEH